MLCASRDAAFFARERDVQKLARKLTHRNIIRLYDIAEVMRDLSRLKYSKNLSFGERKMLDQARTLLVKEISVARAKTEEDVLDELEQIIDASQGQRTAASA